MTRLVENIELETTRIAITRQGRRCEGSHIGLGHSLQSAVDFSSHFIGSPLPFVPWLERDNCISSSWTLSGSHVEAGNQSHAVDFRNIAQQILYLI